MKRVVIESPLSGNFARNIRYARLCMVDSFRRNEAPFLSHLLYTQTLDDELPQDRKLGMSAGLAWSEAGELAAVYVDLGISDGMRLGIEHHKFQNIPVETRHLPPDLMELLDCPKTGTVRPTRGMESRPPTMPPGEANESPALVNDPEFQARRRRLFTP